MMEFEVQYEAGHSYRESWEKSALFCPQCGQQSVWQEQAPGDYYVGEGYICMSCRSSWTIQGPYMEDVNWQHAQRIDAITKP